MGIPFFPKRATEKYVAGLDFTDEMPASVTIASCSCSARVRKTGVDATSVLLADGTAATVDSVTNQAKITLSIGGAIGTLYELFFLATLSDGQKRSGYALVMVDD